MTLSTKNPAHGCHRGGALETVHAGSLNDFEDTTALLRFQASKLAHALALMPDTASALALLAFGEARA